MITKAIPKRIMGGNVSAPMKMLEGVCLRNLH